MQQAVEKLLNPSHNSKVEEEDQSWLENIKPEKNGWNTELSDGESWDNNS
jgi:hypothetical protein